MQPNTLLKCIAALALVGACPAGAGSLAVSPLRLTFANAAQITALTVENHGREDALVQLETFAWTQRRGEHKLDPTDDVIAVPPVFRLRPGAQQRVRVGLTREFTGNAETTFRLTVTEVPTAIKLGTVAVAVRHSLPIFVLPSSATASSLTVKAAAGSGLEITNNGSRHMQILRWRLRDPNGTVVSEGGGPGYLLSGASQPIALAGPLVSGLMVFEADSDARTLKIDVGQ
jgi:fimbrial chaperone protein